MFQPQESLKVIQTIIDSRKRKYEENGFFFIFWGVLIIVAALAQFIILKCGFAFKYSAMVWAVLMPLGFVFTFVAKFRAAKKEKEKQKNKDWNEWLWLVVGIWAIACGFTSPGASHVIMIIYLPLAVASLATALQFKNRAWVISVLISFGLVFSTIYIRYKIYSLLLIACLSILLFLIPGISLYSNNKKRKQIEENV